MSVSGLYIGGGYCRRNPGTTRLLDFHAYARFNKACCGSAPHINGMHNVIANLHCKPSIDRCDHLLLIAHLLVNLNEYF